MPGVYDILGEAGFGVGDGGWGDEPVSGFARKK